MRLNVSVSYPGTLGIKTDKGQQNNYPLTLDAPTVSYEVMKLRYDTGALSTDAPEPTPDLEPELELALSSDDGSNLLDDNGQVMETY